MTPNLHVVTAGERLMISRLIPGVGEDPWQVFLYTARTGGTGDDFTMSDFTEPTWSGYARQDIENWVTPDDDGTGRQVGEADNVTFTPTEEPTVEILGRGITDHNGDLFAFANFPTPIELVDGIDFVLPIALTNRSEIGG